MADAPPIPDSLRKLMAEIGPRWGTDIPKHVKLMVESFTPILATAPKDGVAFSLDLPYGPHPRQTLDVHQPGGAANAPVVVFLHGGAFVDGEKRRTPEVYGNVLTYFARHGVLGINLEFRLAPEFKYPACAEDVSLAVAWLRENVARFGGDPDQIFLMGQSAGAAHAAAYAYNRRLQPPGGPGIAGLIVVSGRVRADNLPENPNARKVEAYYGTDPAVMEEGSAVNHVSAASVPTFIAIAEYENPLIDVYCAELFHRLAIAKRRAPPIMRLAGHNHISIVTHFNTAEDALGRALLDFVRSPR